MNTKIISFSLNSLELNEKGRRRQAVLSDLKLVGTIPVPDRNVDLDVFHAKSGRLEFFVALIPGTDEVIGGLALNPHKDGKFQIFNWSMSPEHRIHPEWRKMGIVKSIFPFMMNDAVDRGHHVFIDTFTNKVYQTELYKLGFRPYINYSDDPDQVMYTGAIYP